ncbi:hypothetical protein GUITHDRAFT_117269 [Guillardia theta CCMP2712]|uniref:Uncharacterized protein n=1 Tax=Guillardia theta (strain CCMP2712) TaxID=905079 RepID=L1IL13_GUITC|nr:hypothetical protein GUITHDRAFT_117269 [Guillardia theta CCMP2712]EKX36604.1 hypothetical protein GUITHDRAFT_117269 [Guillardia theta CCMP2712]|eukprot:XP_005823584.1 hypothetical protein GUITHDRAFT_117269 [Guillardia theta CCMP2712]
MDRSWYDRVVLAENSTNITSSEPWEFPDYPVTESEWEQWEISHGMPAECEPMEEESVAPDGTKVKTYYADCSKRAGHKSTLAAVSRQQQKEASLNRLKIKQNNIRFQSPPAPAPAPAVPPALLPLGIHPLTRMCSKGSSANGGVIKEKAALHRALSKKLHQPSGSKGLKASKFNTVSFNRRVKEEGKSLLAKDKALAAKGKFSKASGAAAQILQLMRQSGNFAVPSMGYVGPKL